MENECEILTPFEAEPVKIYEDVSLLNFLSFDDYKDSEIGFKMEFPLFDDLEIIIMNAENHTPEEVELAKQLLLEQNEKLKVARGRCIHDEYPDYELFDNLDYTFEKMKFEDSGFSIKTTQKTSNDVFLISKPDINEHTDLQSNRDIPVQ